MLGAVRLRHRSSQSCWWCSAAGACLTVGVDGLVDGDGLVLCGQCGLLLGERLGLRLGGGQLGVALLALDGLTGRSGLLLRRCLALGCALRDVLLALLRLLLEPLLALLGRLLDLLATALSGLTSRVELIVGLEPLLLGNRLELSRFLQLGDAGLTKPAAGDKLLVAEQPAHGRLDCRLDTFEGHRQRPLLVAGLAGHLGGGGDGQPRGVQRRADDEARQLAGVGQDLAHQLSFRSGSSTSAVRRAASAWASIVAASCSATSRSRTACVSTRSTIASCAAACCSTATSLRAASDSTAALAAASLCSICCCWRSAAASVWRRCRSTSTSRSRSVSSARCSSRSASTASSFACFAASARSSCSSPSRRRSSLPITAPAACLALPTARSTSPPAVAPGIRSVMKVLQRKSFWGTP